MSTGTTTAEARATATAVYDLTVVGAAVLLSLVAGLLWGFGREALAASAGGLLAVANWLALRWLVVRLLGARPSTSQTGRRKVLLALLFAAKILVLLGAVWALIRWEAFEPLPLAFGYSSLVLGLLGAAFLWGRERAAGGADA
jgi:hypothetical protein